MYAPAPNPNPLGHVARHTPAQIKELVEKIYAIPDGMSSQARRPVRVRGSTCWLYTCVR